MDEEINDEIGIQKKKNNKIKKKHEKLNKIKK